MSITGDSYITTSEGLVQVNHLVHKQYTAIINGKQYLSDVSGFCPQGIKEVFELKLKCGLVLKATADQKILIRHKPAASPLMCRRHSENENKTIMLKDLKPHHEILVSGNYRIDSHFKATVMDNIHLNEITYQCDRIVVSFTNLMLGQIQLLQYGIFSIAFPDINAVYIQLF